MFVRPHQTPSEKQIKSPALLPHRSRGRPGDVPICEPCCLAYATWRRRAPHTCQKQRLGNDVTTRRTGRRHKGSTKRRGAGGIERKESRCVRKGGCTLCDCVFLRMIGQKVATTHVDTVERSADPVGTAATVVTCRTAVGHASIISCSLSSAAVTNGCTQIAQRGICNCLYLSGRPHACRVSPFERLVISGSREAAKASEHPAEEEQRPANMRLEPSSDFSLICS